MLLLRSVRAYPRQIFCPNRLRRTLFTETLQTLTSGYLDLATALPYPPSWPVYSCTIVLLGVTSRLVLLPINLWARRREHRTREIVVPYLNAYRAKLEERARQELTKTDSVGARDYFHHAVSKKLKAKRVELFNYYRCNPWVTMLVPPVSQIPVFVLLSAAFFHAANEPGSVLRNEACLTLRSLAHPDPTATLPIILGLISFATVETSRWFATETQRRRFAEIARQEQAAKAQGKVVIQPMKYTKSILRGLSVARIVLAAMTPGSVEIYWLTSATFGLFTNWAMNYGDYRRELSRNTRSTRTSSIGHPR